MKKIIYFLICNLFLISLCSASVSTLNYAFNFSEQTKNFGVSYSSSVLLQLTTPAPVFCKYSLIKGRDYNSMEGTFDNNYETLHRKFLLDLEEGIYKYYIKCSGENFTSGELEVLFIINKPVSGNIKISKTPPLTSGTYEITLTTSKLVEGKPLLSYSFDSVVYETIPLSGSGAVWKGYLIIPGSVGETVGSFKFSAKDLDGKTGELLLGEVIFVVNTKKPMPVSIISATGYEGQIRLNWYYSQKNIKEFRIYRSESPNLDYTSYYKSVDSNYDYFTDNNAQKGKTYYYRIAPVDYAENIADLSKEVQATSLLDNITVASGLKTELRGKVDNLIVSIDLLREMIENTQKNINNKPQTEKNIFQVLRLDKELETSKTEILSIKRDAENLKLQDLKESELDIKINALELKINILRKKIPEDLIISEKRDSKKIIQEQEIQKTILEYNPLLDEKTYTRYIRESKKLLEQIDFSNTFYQIKLIYLDGSSREISFFEHEVNSEFSAEPGKFLVLNIPNEIAGSSNQIKIINLNYETLRDSPLFSFNFDTKKIQYYTESKKEPSSIDNVIILPVSEITQEPPKITGNFLLNITDSDNLVGVILGTLLIVLLIYFVYLRKNHSEKVFSFLKKISLLDENIKNKNYSGAQEVYLKLKEEYKLLSSKEKSKVYLKWLELQKNLKK